MRWKTFGRDYMDQRFWPWYDRIFNKQNMGEESGYSFRVTQKRHEHGNCIWALSYSKVPSPVISLMSRTVYIQPTSILELSVIGLIADRYLEEFGEQLEMRWMISQLQFTPLWAFTWIMAHFNRYKEYLGEGVPEKIEGEKRNRTLVNFWRTHHQYNEFLDGWVPPYHRQRRLFMRTQEMMEGAEPRLITDFPIKRELQLELIPDKETK